MDGHDWSDIIRRIDSRDVIESSGRRWRTSCVSHADSTPSLDLYDDGGFYCHGCGDKGSYIDLMVYAECGRKLSPREHPHDSRMRQAYAKAFEEARERSWSTSSYGISRQDRERRSFTAVEQEFLMACHEQVFRPSLLSDLEMKEYLRGRGIYDIHPALGSCRPTHWPMISDIAYNQFNDRTLIDSVGFESRKRPGSLMIGYMILTFNFHQGKINYYQGRRMKYDSSWRYYNPPDIKKIPITLAAMNTDHPLMIGSEGLYKTAWLTQYGWTPISFMDDKPEKWSITDITRLKDSLFCEDNDSNGQGQKAGTLVSRISWSENLDITIVKTPDPHKDLDSWATSRNMKQAAAHLRALHDYR